MEKDFSALDQRERVAQCLQNAEAARSRASASTDMKTRDLYLRLAECWLSLSRSFETAAMLANGRFEAPSQVKRTAMPRAVDVSLPIGLKGFAA